MKQNKRIMNTETLIKIREWEAERDRNLRIHCPLVAAKFQRWIDKAKKVKPEPVYVKCRNCKNASDFGDNSAYCRAKGHRVCACDRYGQICNSFQKKES